MYSTHQQLITLAIAYTCLGVFIATAIAAVLDMFNFLRLAPEIRKRLHVVLIVEIVVIAVVSFKGFLDPSTVVDQVKSINTANQELSNYVAKSTKHSESDVQTARALAVAVKGGIPFPISFDRLECKGRLTSIRVACGQTYILRYNPERVTYLLTGKSSTGEIHALASPAHQPPGDKGAVLTFDEGVTLLLDYNQLMVSTLGGVVGRIVLNYAP